MVQDTVQPEVFDLRLLQRLSITTDGVTRDEALAAMVGRYLYSDLPATPTAFGDDRIYRATRVDIDAVRRVVDRYTTLFGTPDQDQTSRIARSLAASANRFYTLNQAGQIDPPSFREYLQRGTGEGESLAYVEQLEGLLAELRTLGLGTTELRQTRNRLLADITPKDRLSVEQMGRVVERRRGS